jgi:hypothetical protein
VNVVEALLAVRRRLIAPRGALPGIAHAEL